MILWGRLPWWCIAWVVTAPLAVCFFFFLGWGCFVLRCFAVFGGWDLASLMGLSGITAVLGDWLGRMAVF